MGRIHPQNEGTRCFNVGSGGILTVVIASLYLLTEPTAELEPFLATCLLVPCSAARAALLGQWEGLQRHGLGHASLWAALGLLLGAQPALVSLGVPASPLVNRLVRMTERVKVTKVKSLLRC